MLNLIFLDIDFLLFFMILFKCFKFFGDLLGELYELLGDLLFIELLVLFDEFWLIFSVLLVFFLLLELCLIVV